MIKDYVEAYIDELKIITENSDQARALYDQQRYGILLEDGRIQLSFLETLYLLEKKKIVLKTTKNRSVSFDQTIQKLKKKEKNVWVKYVVFRDLRNRGYIVKTALKFGADFRVYDRGIKPGEDHAKWVVYPSHETQALTWRSTQHQKTLAYRNC